MLTFEAGDGRRKTGDGREESEGLIRRVGYGAFSGVCARMVICR